VPHRVPCPRPSLGVAMRNSDGTSLLVRVSKRSVPPLQGGAEPGSGKPGHDSASRNLRVLSSSAVLFCRITQPSCPFTAFGPGKDSDPGHVITVAAHRSGAATAVATAGRTADQPPMVAERLGQVATGGRPVGCTAQASQEARLFEKAGLLGCRKAGLLRCRASSVSQNLWNGPWSGTAR